LDHVQQADGTTLLDNTLITYDRDWATVSTHSVQRPPIHRSRGGGKRVPSRDSTSNLPEGNFRLANLVATQAEMMGVAQSTDSPHSTRWWESHCWRRKTGPGKSVPLRLLLAHDRQTEKEHTQWVKSVILRSHRLAVDSASWHLLPFLSL